MRILLVLSVFLLAVAPVASAEKTICVDAEVGPGGDGESWATAFKYLQDALAVADVNDEIRVARGTYMPDRSTITPKGSGDREATFRLINGVSIRGGYAGYGEPDPNARDVDAYKTVLSGDLAGDDGADFLNNDENSYHVTIGSGTDANALLEGFIITAGNANHPDPFNRGGGMYNDSGKPMVTDCIFTGNDLSGMYNKNSSSPIVTNCSFTMNNDHGVSNYWQTSSTFINCTFSDNSTDFVGGGIYNAELSNSTLINCELSGNSAGNYGGGMYNGGSSHPIIINCIFSGNSAGTSGGAIHSYPNNPGYSPIINCIFIGNTSDGTGGAIFGGHCASPAFSNCTFYRNSARWAGGAMANPLQSFSSLANCILWANDAEEGPQISMGGGASLSIDYCDIQGDRIDIDGGEFVDWGPGNIDAEPYFADPLVGDFRLKSQAGRWDPNERRWTTDEVTSPCIDVGDPNSDWTAELWPHGKRVNMGAFGGTPQASMSLATLGNVADVDGSGRVDYADMELITQIWLRQEVLLPEDLNRDATVNFYDFAEFVEEWLWDGL